MSADLDKVDKLEPGRGRLELGIGASGDFETGRAFGYADYAHRLNDSLSAFARGEVGYDTGLDSGYWSTIGGLRIRF